MRELSEVSGTDIGDQKVQFSTRFHFFHSLKFQNFLLEQFFNFSIFVNLFEKTKQKLVLKRKKLLITKHSDIIHRNQSSVKTLLMIHRKNRDFLNNQNELIKVFAFINIFVILMKGLAESEQIRCEDSQICAWGFYEDFQSKVAKFHKLNE